jgi:hypothetical protein
VLSSGALSAKGNVSISATQALKGRIDVDLARSRGTVGVPLEVGGTVDDPTVLPTRGAMLGAAVGTLIAPGAGTAVGATAGNRLSDSLRGLFGK